MRTTHQNIILNYTDSHSIIYRVEILTDESFHDDFIEETCYGDMLTDNSEDTLYDTFQKQSAHNNKMCYYLTETEYGTRKIHLIPNVYSQIDNDSEYFYETVDTDQIRKLHLPFALCKVYRPSDAPIDRDILISAATYRTRRNSLLGEPEDLKSVSQYSQLYGGIYSLSEFNSIGVIKDNYNNYCEYITFKIPLLDTDSITIQLIPLKGFWNKSLNENFRYNVSDLIQYAKTTFTLEKLLELNVKFDINDEGIAGYKIFSDNTNLRELHRLFFSEYTGFSYKFRLSIFLTTDGTFDWDATGNQGIWYKQEEYTWNTDYDDDKISDFIGLSDSLPLECNLIGMHWHTTDDKGNTSSNVFDPQEWANPALQNSFEIAHLEELSWKNCPKQLFVRGDLIIKNIDNDIVAFHSPVKALTKDLLKYVIEPGNRKIQLETMNINIINDTPLEAQLPLQTVAPARIYYKPLFFRTYQGLDINLVPGVTQKIGIDLQEYQTKVHSFQLQIDGMYFNEIGRTEIYTLFEIPAGKLSNNVTTYVILDQDLQFITNGKITYYI